MKMAESVYAHKRKAIERILQKNGLKEIPRDRDTGKWVTAKITGDMQTEKNKVRRRFVDQRILYICPKCGKPIEHQKKMHKNRCMQCGQYLDWEDYDAMNGVYIQASDSSEAAYWAEKYRICNGTTYKIDIDAWRLKLKEPFPIVLFFPFPEGKDYGKFMRMAGKEAIIVKEE